MTFQKTGFIALFLGGFGFLPFFYSHPAEKRKLYCISLLGDRSDDSKLIKKMKKKGIKAINLFAENE